MTITNPNPKRCPEVGDIYNLNDICIGHNVNEMFKLLDDLIEAANELPSWLHMNVTDEIGFVVHTFCVPFYIEMEKFFNLPKGSVFSKNNDSPFECCINRLDRTITVEKIDDSFEPPDNGINLDELLNSADIDARDN